MAVEAIQNNSTYNSGRMSVAGSAAFGALAGYTLKWALPITHQERDDSYNFAMQKINNESKNTRNSEKKLIIATTPKLEGVDTFKKMDKNGTLTLSEIEKLESTESEKVKKLFIRMRDAGLETKAKGKKELTIFTKSIRPTVAFAIIGAAIGIAIALIHNIFREINASNAEYDRINKDQS